MKLKRSFYNLFFNILSQIVTFSLGIILPRLFLTNLGSEVNGLVSSVGQVFACVGLLSWDWCDDNTGVIQANLTK